MNRWQITWILISIAAFTASYFLRRLVTTNRGMKQFARDKRAQARVSGVFAERKELLEQATKVSDAQIRKGIEKVLAGDTNAANTWSQMSDKLGRRMEPFLIAALQDSRANPPEEKASFGKDSPFEKIMQMLAHAGSDEIIPRLAPYLADGPKHLRIIAALNIAKLGSPAAAEPTIQALRHSDTQTRTYAIMGVSWTEKLNGASQSYKHLVQQVLQPIVAGETGFNEYDDRDASEALLALDRAAAIEHLSSPRCLRLGNPHLPEVLKVLNEAAAKLDPAILRSILSASTPVGDVREHRHSYAHAAALTALASADPVGAAPAIDAALKSDDERIRSGAVAGLLRVHGLPEAYQLWPAHDLPGGFDALPPPVKHVLAANAFENEVKNGGISQYFFNSAGNQWPIALQAFQSMGCAKCAEILTRAVDMLGRKATASDRELRIKAYAQLSDAREKPLDDLSDEFYKDEDLLDVRRARYMVQHADIIRETAAQFPKGKQSE